jgi:lipoprotein-anchoring transpeptidase ErfK/SrfK
MERAVLKHFMMVFSVIPLLGMPESTIVRSPAVHEPRSLRRELTVDVDLSARRLVVKIDGRQAGSYEVAVGKPEHRTPTGTYKLSQVVWNPSWVPPDEAWADTADKKEPGEQGNPMGRVKILFDEQLYIHGTSDHKTLGDPVSHGCIRMRNADAMKLARLVMEYGGASKPSGWYSTVQKKPKESFEVPIPDPPVLRITQ